MMRLRPFWSVYLFLLLSLFVPHAMTSAQDETERAFMLASWIPSDYAGFLQFASTDMAETFQVINLASFSGGILAPDRPPLGESLTIAQLIPLDLLDSETASFQQNILAWLGDEVVFAYHEIPDTFAPEQEDIALIISTRDMFQSAASLSTIFQEQDFLTTETYQNIPLYHGDQISIAVTPQAVIFASDARIRELIDTQTTPETAITATENFQHLQQALDANPSVFGYVHGEATLHVLNLITSGNLRGTAVRGAFAEALETTQGGLSPAQSLLGGRLQAAGFSITADVRLFSSVNTKFAFIPEVTSETLDLGFEADLLNFIPRQALFVHAGTDSQAALRTGMTLLPLSNFIGSAWTMFGIRESNTSSNEILPPPSGATILNALESLNGFLETQDVPRLDQLIGSVSGSYLTAVLPRPNNPTPVLNTPFDVIVVLQSDDAQKALDDLTQTAQLILNVDVLSEVEIGGISFQSLMNPQTGETILSAGMFENYLILASGDGAQFAVSAYQGDNQLIDETRWQNVESDRGVFGYLSIDGLYNTFLMDIVQQLQNRDILNMFVGWTSYEADHQVYVVDIQIDLP